MTIGIDQIAFDTTTLFVDLRDLAQARGDEPDKYTIGIGQDQQAVVPSSQDIVTLGASAASRLTLDPARLGLIALGTESGVDASKAAALYVQRLLKLGPWVRAVELKEACYGGTAALMMARDYVAAHPDRQALVIAADVARYGLATPGEVTQGAGAVAMVVSAEPRLLALSDDSVHYAEDIQDFWRPVYTDRALARGKFSTEQYLRFFNLVWARYKATTGRGIADFKALCFHLPYTKMGLKALRQVLPEATPAQQAALSSAFTASAAYSRRVGNLYTGSLYLGLLSLLEHASDLAEGDRIGLFSYGSGAVGEFFSATLQPGFAAQLDAAGTLSRLDARRRLTVAEYESVFNDKVPYGPADYEADPALFAGRFVLTGVTGQERQYRANA
ncbi:hydroxymethylglutaryl-CoA synthase [Lacticaseibacillus kribbianus]|uniref:hydroxymethylglutaryl-CoA synthase n=1 Tax=Lacticaseibacillus kribbianus TaxID=2926292 RepID=UPI001CD3CDC3